MFPLGTLRIFRRGMTIHMSRNANPRTGWQSARTGWQSARTRVAIRTNRGGNPHESERQSTRTRWQSTRTRWQSTRVGTPIHTSRNTNPHEPGGNPHESERQSTRVGKREANEARVVVELGGKMRSLTLLDKQRGMGMDTVLIEHIKMKIHIMVKTTYEVRIWGTTDLRNPEI
jgi:hypothetical protein